MSIITEEIKEDVQQLIKETNKYISENRVELKNYKSKLEEAKNPQERSLCRSLIYHTESMIKNLEVLNEKCKYGIKSDSVVELDQALVLAGIFTTIYDAHYEMILNIRGRIDNLESK